MRNQPLLTPVYSDFDLEHMRRRVFPAVLPWEQSQDKSARAFLDTAATSASRARLADLVAQNRRVLDRAKPSRDWGFDPNEKRDESGKWTKGGNTEMPKGIPSPDSPQANQAVIANQNEWGFRPGDKVRRKDGGVRAPVVEVGALLNNGAFEIKGGGLASSEYYEKAIDKPHDPHEKLRLHLEENPRHLIAPAQLSYEAAPGRTTQHMQEFHNASWEQRQEYQDAIMKAISDENGNDLIAQNLGLKTKPTFKGVGAYGGHTNPGAQAQAAFDVEDLDPATAEKITIGECVRGMLLKQDAIAWHKPKFLPQHLKGAYLIPTLKIADGKFVSGKTHAHAFQNLPEAERLQYIAEGKNNNHDNFLYRNERGQYLNRERASEYASQNGLLREGAMRQRYLIAEDLKPDAASPGTRLRPSDTNMLDFDVGRPLDPAEAVHIMSVLKETGNDMLAPIATPTGWRLLNIPELTGVDNANFERTVIDTLSKSEAGDLPADVVYRAAHSEGDYVENDWSKAPNGELYQERINAGSPDVQRSANALLAFLGPRVEAVERTFEQKYGWKRDAGIHIGGPAKAADARRHARASGVGGKADLVPLLATVLARMREETISFGNGRGPVAENPRPARVLPSSLPTAGRGTSHV